MCACSHVWCVAGVTVLYLLKLKYVMFIILLCFWNLSPIYSSHTDQIIQFSENKNDTQIIQKIHNNGDGLNEDYYRIR